MRIIFAKRKRPSIKKWPFSLVQSLCGCKNTISAIRQLAEADRPALSQIVRLRLSFKEEYSLERR